MLSSRSHPKLFSRGSEVADADLKFKGAPSDDCDPFAIQNYIDRLAAEVYDSLHGTKLHSNKHEEKDEWELMKEKARGVPFQEVSLSIALKHGLMEEVKKENANKQFEKENIMTIMKVRDDFLRDYPSASSFEYQWQIWVEWERYLKQIGVTIPQWGKVARKLIRLGVTLIQDDMTKKYSQISAGTHKRKSEGDIMQASHERKRRPSAIEATSQPGCLGVGFNNYITQTLEHSAPAGHFFSEVTPFGSMQFASSPSASLSSSPVLSASPSATFGSPFSPLVKTSLAPQQQAHQQAHQQHMFGASLYNMIASQAPNATPGMLFSSPNPSHASPSNTPSGTPSSSCAPSPIITFDTLSYQQPQHGMQFHHTSGILPYPYNDASSGLIMSSTSLPTVSHPTTRIGPYIPPLVLPPQLPTSSLSSPSSTQASPRTPHTPHTPHTPSYTAMQCTPPPSPSQMMATYSPLSMPLLPAK